VKPNPWRERTLLGAAFATALALRLTHLIAYHEDIDALRFALGVERFDPAALRPHAPFYPVFIALAKLTAALSGQGALRSLGLVSAASGALAVVLSAALARRVAGPRALGPALLLGLCSPFLWLSSVKVHSDMVGTVFVLGALWLAVSPPGRPTPARALVAAGLGLGARLSYFPFAWVLLLRGAWRDPRPILGRARDLAFGALLWLVPLVLVAGAGPLLRVSLLQGEGHFATWGGTVLTVPSLPDRLHGLFWGLWANGLGGAYPDAPSLRWLALPGWLVLFGLLARRARGLVRVAPLAAWGAAAYLAWAFLGQNIAYKPRHLLPVVPLFLAACAASVARARGAQRVVGLVAVGLVAAVGFADGLALVRAHQAPSPASAIVAYLSENTDDSRPVLTLDLGRMVREGAPRRRVLEPRDVAASVRSAAQDGPLLVTSEALPAPLSAALRAEGLVVTVVFSRPRSRYVDPLWSDLALLEVRAPTGP
jgi:hypothetical protein